MTNSINLKRIDDIRLTEEERIQVRSAIERHISSTKSPFTSQETPFHFTSSIFHKLATSTLLVAILFVSGWGTLLASQSSLPGHPLYFIKRNVSEIVTPYFLTNPTDKAEYQSELVFRRLDEAKILSREGKLTPQTKKSLEKSIDIHTENAVVAVKDGLKTSARDTEENPSQSIASSDVSTVQASIAFAKVAGSADASKILLESLPDSTQLIVISSSTSPTSTLPTSSTASFATPSSQNTESIPLSPQEKVLVGTIAIDEAQKAAQVIEDLLLTIHSSEGLTAEQRSLFDGKVSQLKKELDRSLDKSVSLQKKNQASGMQSIISISTQASLIKSELTYISKATKEAVKTNDLKNQEDQAVTIVKNEAQNVMTSPVKEVIPSILK